MPSVIVEASTFGNVVRMSVVDEVLYLFTVFLLILAIFFVLDLGLDIEEDGATIPATLATMSL